MRQAAAAALDAPDCRRDSEPDGWFAEGSDGGRRGHTCLVVSAAQGLDVPEDRMEISFVLFSAQIILQSQIESVNFNHPCLER
jgi:hypothetical protein